MKFCYVVLGILVCLAAATGAAADYTDDLWNDSEPREYYDCGDWSGVHNAKDTDLGGHCYWYSKHRRNGRYIFNPTNWGYPSDACLKQAGFSDIEWTCVYIRGFDKELNFDRKVYTDNPKNINYKTSYLYSIHWITRYWHIYRTESDKAYRDTGHSMTIRNAITFYAKHTDDDGDEHYKDKTYYPEDTAGYTLFERPDWNVSVDLVNHSTYMLLTVPTPEHITGLKMVLESENTTAEYEKHFYCLKLNKSRKFMTCDLVGYNYHNFTGISPFGHEVYLVPYEPDYRINITLYTPFEQIEANVSVVETDVDPVNTSIVLDPLFGVLCLLMPILLTLWMVRLV